LIQSLSALLQREAPESLMAQLDEARKTIAEALQTLDFGKSERLVRINPVGSGLENDDLQSVLPYRPDRIVIPKVQEGQQVGWVSEKISEFERVRGWPAGEIALLALIESARAIVNLAEIATSSSRLQGFIFGTEDLAGDIGAVRTRPGWEVFYARSAAVTYAAAFGLQAIDLVFLDFHDEEGLRAESLQVCRWAILASSLFIRARLPRPRMYFHPLTRPSPRRCEWWKLPLSSRKPEKALLHWTEKWWMHRWSRLRSGC
jgi:hypothetical protein